MCHGRIIRFKILIICRGKKHEFFIWFFQKRQGTNIYSPSERTPPGIQGMNPPKADLASQWTFWGYLQEHKLSKTAALPTNPPPNGVRAHKLLSKRSLPHLQVALTSLTSGLVLGIVTCMWPWGAALWIFQDSWVSWALWISIASWVSWASFSL